MVGLRLPSNLKAAHLGGLSASELKNDSMSLSERQLKIHRLPRVAPPKRSEGGEWRAKRSLGSGDPASEAQRGAASGAETPHPSSLPSRAPTFSRLNVVAESYSLSPTLISSGIASAGIASPEAVRLITSSGIPFASSRTSDSAPCTHLLTQIPQPMHFS